MLCTLRPARRRSKYVVHAFSLLSRRQLLTKSYVKGSLEPPLSSKTLPDFFDTEILAKYAQRPALICRQEKAQAHGGPPSKNLHGKRHLAWDYEEFDRHNGALARGLTAMGVKKGDRVGVIMGNNRFVELTLKGSGL